MVEVLAEHILLDLHQNPNLKKLKKRKKMLN